METKRQVISKWKKKKNGQNLEMVVYKTPIGKNKKGRQIFKSVTRHEAVKRT